MSNQKYIYAIFVACFLLTFCKREVKKETVTNFQKVSLAISGMSCEISCARTIQSKLAKKEGVFSAKVTFKDSLAEVEFDANKIAKSEIINFIDKIGGNLYKASEISKEKHVCCSLDCKKKCILKKKKECVNNCKKECCTKTLIDT